MKKKICTSAFIAVLLCTSLFAGGSKEKNDNSATIPPSNNANGGKFEFKNEEVPTKTIPVKRTWDDEVALMEVEGNVVLSEEEYPEKIVKWLDGEGEKIIKMARCPDGSLIFYSKDTKDVGWLYNTDKNKNVTHALTSEGFEWWRDYDSNGNVIHYRNSDGYEQWNDYDERGNVISYRWITADKRSYRETTTYDNVKVSKNSTTTRQTYSKTTNDSNKNVLEIWYTYSKNYDDTDKWDERNFVTQIRFKADGSWSITINGKRLEDIYGEGMLRFEMLPNGKMKVTPDSGDWWIVD